MGACFWLFLQSSVSIRCWRCVLSYRSVIPISCCSRVFCLLSVSHLELAFWEFVCVCLCGLHIWSQVREVSKAQFLVRGKWDSQWLVTSAVYFCLIRWSIELKCTALCFRYCANKNQRVVEHGKCLVELDSSSLHIYPDSSALKCYHRAKPILSNRNSKLRPDLPSLTPLRLRAGSLKRGLLTMWHVISTVFPFVCHTMVMSISRLVMVHPWASWLYFLIAFVKCLTCANHSQKIS